MEMETELHLSSERARQALAGVEERGVDHLIMSWMRNTSSTMDKKTRRPGCFRPNAEGQPPTVEYAGTTAEMCRAAGGLQDANEQTHSGWSRAVPCGW